MATTTNIKLSAGDVAAERQRQGIDPHEHVTLTIEPERIPGRRESRKLVIAAGLTDDKFLELAINGHADLILTGDKDLLALLRLTSFAWTCGSKPWPNASA